MMMEIPDRLPTEPTDRAVAILGLFGSMMIPVEIEFGHRLDADRLARAYDLLLDAEPVLGCRFVPHRRTPWWQRLDRTERPPLLVAESEEEYESFRKRDLGADSGPQVRACLLRGSEDGDRLLLKITHLAADAGGSKEVTGILASIYNRLATQPDFVPAPNLLGSRGVNQVLRRVPLRAYPRIFWNYLVETASQLSPRPVLTLPSGGDARMQSGAATYVVRHIDAGRAARIADFGRARGATINDLMCAAFLRAQIMLGPPEKARLKMMTTVDLRRHYLPLRRAEGVCNISAIELLDLGAQADPSFDILLARVAEAMRSKKRHWFGIHPYVFAIPLLRILPFSWSESVMLKIFGTLLAKSRFANALTNMGPFEPETVTFDKPARRAWLLCPPMFPPLFGVGLTGYAGSLSLSVGTYPPSLEVAAVERFFDAMLSELPE